MTEKFNQMYLKGVKISVKNFLDFQMALTRGPFSRQIALRYDMIREIANELRKQARTSKLNQGISNNCIRHLDNKYVLWMRLWFLDCLNQPHTAQLEFSQVQQLQKECWQCFWVL